jgi:hypothetical protein
MKLCKAPEDTKVKTIICDNGNDLKENIPAGRLGLLGFESAGQRGDGPCKYSSLQSCLQDVRQ